MMRVQKFYDRYFLAVELCLSVMMFLAIIAPFELHFGRAALGEFVDKSRGGFYSSAASVAGSLLGFVISAVSIILVFGQHLSFLKASGHYSTIFDVFYQAIIWLAAATVWAFVGLFVDSGGNVQFWALYGMIWLLILSCFRVGRCVWILRRVTTLAIKQAEEESA